MLTILGDRTETFCDGLPRRSFLQIGGLALGGMSLPQILRAEAASGVRTNHKGIINIFLPGGPPHQDMWDLKVEAPKEIRGPFQPIATSVPGIEICEEFPLLAGMADKFVFVRSIVGAAVGHAAFQCQTGHSNRGPQPAGGWPAIGSVLSKMLGPTQASVPPFVGLCAPTKFKRWGDPGHPGFLGISHAPFKPNAESRENMTLNGVTLDRLRDRQRVLTSLDRFRREADIGRKMEGIDAFNEQALGILTSSKLAEALDVEREDTKLRDRYGRGTATRQSDGAQKLLDHFLVARRLIQSGVRCVTLAFSRWDWHGGNFTRARQDFPMLDQGVTALIEDLERRDMLDDVTVVVWGEFGRTPKINERAGRDHWPGVSCALLAGGGMRTGQVIGATNRLGEYPTQRPVHFQDVFATMYHNMGIDVRHLTLNDLQGRPQYLVDNDRYGVMQELV
jgi:hypothetical protein